MIDHLLRAAGAVAIGHAVGHLLRTAIERISYSETRLGWWLWRRRRDFQDWRDGR